MADDASLYHARAALETATAESAQLDNVRDRALRSAKAWTDLAVRAENTTLQRERRDAETAARAAAARPRDDEPPLD